MTIIRTWKPLLLCSAVIVVAGIIGLGVGFPETHAQNSLLQQTKKPSRPVPALTAEGEVQAALNDAIRLLETKDYRTFIVKYVPVDGFRVVRDRNDLNNAAALREQFDGTETAGLIVLLKKFRKAKPKFVSSGLVAKLSIVDGGAEGNIPLKEKPKITPELKLIGFSRNLSTALYSASLALKNGQIERFVDRMYPASELQRLQTKNAKAKLVARLKKNPAMVRQMHADLDAIKGKQPKLDSTGNIATFTVAAPKVFNPRSRKPKPLDKTFKFQKVQGNWRLFDNSAAVHKEIARQTKLIPPGFTIELTLEKIGGNWRLYEMPK